jgi:hypothetical protein
MTETRAFQEGMLETIAVGYLRNGIRQNRLFAIVKIGFVTLAGINTGTVVDGASGHERPLKIVSTR